MTVTSSINDILIIVMTHYTDVIMSYMYMSLLAHRSNCSDLYFYLRTYHLLTLMSLLSNMNALVYCIMSDCTLNKIRYTSICFLLNQTFSH